MYNNPFINKQRTKYVLFLGAGASKAMYIDDLDGITSRVRNSASTKVKDIIGRLDDLFGDIEETDAIFKLDIEVLFTILNCLANRRQMLNELGPFALLMHYFVKKIPEFMKLEISPETFEEFKQLVTSTIFEALKYSSYSLDQKSRAQQLYDELYKIPIKNDHKFYNAIGRIAPPILKKVSTVNYDLILEIYMGETTVPGVPKFLTERGFKKHAGIEVLNLDGIRDGSMELDYIKLHGSIDWWLDDKRRIIVSHVPDFPYAKLSERIMLYPIYEKYVTRDPYFTLYEYFRKSLFKEDILIIIGYSFRDLSINNTFLEWLHSKPESRLIIAKKKDHEYIKKILENNDKVENRIQFIGEHFAENGFFPLLESTLANPIG